MKFSMKLDERKCEVLGMLNRISLTLLGNYGVGAFLVFLFEKVMLSTHMLESIIFS